MSITPTPAGPPSALGFGGGALPGVAAFAARRATQLASYDFTAGAPTAAIDLTHYASLLLIMRSSGGTYGTDFNPMSISFDTGAFRRAWANATSGLTTCWSLPILGNTAQILSGSPAVSPGDSFTLWGMIDPLPYGIHEDRRGFTPGGTVDGDGLLFNVENISIGAGATQTVGTARVGSGHATVCVSLDGGGAGAVYVHHPATGATSLLAAANFTGGLVTLGFELPAEPVQIAVANGDAMNAHLAHVTLSADPTTS